MVVTAKKNAAAGLLALALFLSAPVHASIIILRTQGPQGASFKPGQSLTPGQEIVLGPGAEIWLVDEEGTRLLRGPGHWRVGETGHGADTVRLNDLTSLIKQAANDDRTSRIAAVRGMPGSEGDKRAARPGNAAPEELLKQIGVDSDGSFCVWGDSVKLIRDMPMPWSDGSVVVITRTSEKTLRFADGKGVDIAVDMLTEGDGNVTLIDGPSMHHARFTRLPPPKNLEDLARTVAQAGCDSTAEAIMKYYPVK